jgi:hypothetical protein
MLAQPDVQSPDEPTVQEGGVVPDGLVTWPEKKAPAGRQSQVLDNLGQLRLQMTDVERREEVVGI